MKYIFISDYSRTEFQFDVDKLLDAYKDVVKSQELIISELDRSIAAIKELSAGLPIECDICWNSSN